MKNSASLKKEEYSRINYRFLLITALQNIRSVTVKNIKMAQTSSFLKLANDSFRCGLFLLVKLPSAFFSGVRVKKADATSCIVTVPYKWFSQNPFRSTYFACLSMGAELSTGVLAMANVYKSKPPVSMLVLKVESTYFKKATSLTTFTCNDGLLFKTAVEKALSSNESQTVVATSIGRNNLNEEVASFFITWSFRSKLNK